eukprot:gene23066-30255_t
MTKRAILIGCNYPGTNAELQGCVNDVWSIKSLLIEIYGFEEDNMVILVDTDDSYTKPTGANIKNAMMEMVGAAEDDDELVIHFSGHGTQLPSPDPDEKDGKDEAICPCDMNIIVDDDMQKIFVPLKEKPTVKFTFIAGENRGTWGQSGDWGADWGLGSGLETGG